MRLWPSLNFLCFTCAQNSQDLHRTKSPMHQVHFNFEGLLLPEIHDYNQMLPTSLNTAAEVSSYQKQPNPKVSNSHES